MENGKWCRQVLAFTGPNVGLEHNGVPDIKDNSSPLEYFRLFFTEYVITLLVEEFNLCCHQCYSQQAASGPLPQDITDEEMKVFIAPILQMGPEDYTEELLVYR
jgi:hypothetical protein